MRPAGATAVLSTKISPAPPSANLPRWTRCHGVARLSGAACCIMGEMTTRFFSVNDRIVNG